MPEYIPKAVTQVIDEVQDGYWNPQTFEEWKQVQVSKAIISAWIEQQNSERQLRKRFANWIFILISFQVIAIFSILLMIGFDVISLTESMINVMIPSIVSEILGMGFIVVKYLFNKSGAEIDKLLGKSIEDSNER